MESLDDEEANICLMVNNEEDEVTLNFSYRDLFCNLKKLNKASSKVRQLVSTSKTIISTLEIEKIFFSGRN